MVYTSGADSVVSGARHANLATLIAVYGVFMTPLGWGWAGFVWVYALAWFLVNDRVKLLPIEFSIRLKHHRQPRTRPILYPRLLRGPMNFISGEAGATAKRIKDWLEAEREIRKDQGKKDVA